MRKTTALTVTIPLMKKYTKIEKAVPVRSGSTTRVKVRTWPAPRLTAASSMAGSIDPAIEEAAVSLGAGHVRTFTRVVLPLLTGTAFSIFVYFFINGMVTVSAVVFLIYPGFNL